MRRNNVFAAPRIIWVGRLAYIGAVRSKCAARRK